MNAIHSLDQSDLNQLYTYADYLSWQFEERVELIKGKILKMAALTNKYQTIIDNFLPLMRESLNNSKISFWLATSGLGVLLESPKNVQLPTVIKPNFALFVNPCERISEFIYQGVPDIILEIIPNKTPKTTKIIKYEQYQEAVVKEYWIVYPNEEWIEIFVLNESGQYRLADIYTRENALNSVLFPELQIDLQKVFIQP